MHISSLSRVAATLCLAVAVTACTTDEQPATAAKQAVSPALAVRALTPRGVVIQQRVAEARRRRPTADETARVASLRGTWQWVADLHHAAMQEAIHDPSLHGLKRGGTQAQRCAAAVRYLTKYSPAIEDRVGRAHSTPADQKAAAEQLARQLGVCAPNAPQASIFAAGRAGHPIVRAKAAVVDGVDVGQVVAAWRDYAHAMAADIQKAKDLGEANEIMDRYLATAATDPDLPAASLPLLAGTIDLAASSALEWDTFARPREGSMFMWGWLSAIGDWVTSVIIGDVEGCIAGVEVEAAYLGTYGYYGSLSGFASITGEFCAYGGILGSIAAAF
jgi:hypothetical protein